jgi:hypothetical protein
MHLPVREMKLPLSKSVLLGSELISPRSKCICLRTK